MRTPPNYKEMIKEIIDVTKKYSCTYKSDTLTETNAIQEYFEGNPLKRKFEIAVNFNQICVFEDERV